MLSAERKDFKGCMPRKAEKTLPCLSSLLPNRTEAFLELLEMIS